MNILCLCPTYGRPALVANALACFLAQDYPAQKRKLLICDDLGQIDPCEEPEWQVLSTRERYPSLPAKYNAMLAYEGLVSREGEGLPTWPGACYWDAVAVWDDDDIYLPWHLSAAVKAIAAGAPAAKPSRVWSLYGAASPFMEGSAGRFHGSLVIGRERLLQIGGWIPTRRADFDQQQIAASEPVCSLPHAPGGWPGYVFRWQSTECRHCSGLMKSPNNEDWYDRFQPADTGPVGQLLPRFDAETAWILQEWLPSIGSDGEPRWELEGRAGI